MTEWFNGEIVGLNRTPGEGMHSLTSRAVLGTIDEETAFFGPPNS